MIKKYRIFRLFHSNDTIELYSENVYVSEEDAEKDVMKYNHGVELIILPVYIPDRK